MASSIAMISKSSSNQGRDEEPTRQLQMVGLSYFVGAQDTRAQPHGPSDRSSGASDDPHRAR